MDVHCSEEGVAREDCLCRHDEGGELVEKAAREGNRFAAGIELNRICDGLVLRDLVGRERFDVGIASSVRADKARLKRVKAGRGRGQAVEELAADGMGRVADRRDAESTIHERNHHRLPR